MTGPASWEPRYADRAARMKASEIRELLKLLDQPDIISFAGGIPDPALFPAEAARDAFADSLKTQEAAGQALQYSTSEGYAPLRTWITGYMARLGVPCEPDNILITSGSQQGLEFLGKLLLSPGDTALVEAPTYLGALQAFSAYEPRYDTLRPEQGNRTASSYAAAAAETGGAVKFAYVVPDFANPSGQTLTLGARERILDLADELDIPVIEDSAYVALRYQGEHVPCIQALEIKRCGDIEQCRVIYCGTFSKTIAPGLRVGWICAASAVIRRLVLIKQASDLHSSSLNQMVMYRLASELFDNQVANAKAKYAKRRDAMLAALKRHMPAGTTWSEPEGGLFVWVTLPAHIDAAELLKRAVAEQRVAFVPGGAFFADGSGANTLRLSFSLADEAQIEEGIRRIGKLVAAS